MEALCSQTWVICQKYMAWHHTRNHLHSLPRSLERTNGPYGGSNEYRSHSQFSFNIILPSTPISSKVTFFFRWLPKTSPASFFSPKRSTLPTHNQQSLNAEKFSNRTSRTTNNGSAMESWPPRMPAREVVEVTHINTTTCKISPL